MSNIISNIQDDLKIVSPYLTWIDEIVKAAAGNSSTTSTVATAVKAVATTAIPAASASFNLGITSDVGQGFQAVTAVTNLITQRDKELNTTEMEQAAFVQKIQALKDHAAAVISYAEATGDLTGIKLLLS